jgi:hypothetical protein
MKGASIGLRVIQGLLGLIMLFLVIKLVLIFWDWGIWQDLFGIGK